MLTHNEFFIKRPDYSMESERAKDTFMAVTDQLRYEIRPQLSRSLRDFLRVLILFLTNVLVVIA